MYPLYFCFYSILFFIYVRQHTIYISLLITWFFISNVSCNNLDLYLENSKKTLILLYNVFLFQASFVCLLTILSVFDLIRYENCSKNFIFIWIQLLTCTKFKILEYFLRMNQFWWIAINTIQQIKEKDYFHIKFGAVFMCNKG